MNRITGFQKTHRNLPHWQDAGATFFLTWRTLGTNEMKPESRDLVLSAILFWHKRKWHVFATVVMPDHVHVLSWPLPISDDQNDGFHDLSTILHSVKSFSAKEINKIENRVGRFWQDETYDRIIRNDREFHEYWDYILGNPVKKNICERPEDYKWLFQDNGTG